MAKSREINGLQRVTIDTKRMQANGGRLQRMEAVAIGTEGIGPSITQVASVIKQNGNKATCNNVDIWVSLLKGASVHGPRDFTEEAIARFVGLTMSEIEHGRLTASSSVMRQCHELWRIIRESGVGDDTHEKVRGKLYEAMKLLGLPVRHTEPYCADDIVLMLHTLDCWVADRSSAPSLNGHGSGERRRPPSLPQLLRLRALVALCAATGPRISALRSLGIRDLDLDGGVLHYSEEKGRIFVETHTARVSEFVVERVRPWVEWLDANRPWETHLASRLRGSEPGAVNETSLTRPLRHLCVHLGILEESGDDKVKERCGFHRFRSSIAVYAFEEGIPPHVVARALSQRDLGQVASEVYGRRAHDTLADQGRAPLQRMLETLLGEPGGGEDSLDALRVYFETMEGLGGTDWRSHREEADIPGSVAHTNFVMDAAMNMTAEFPTDYHAMEAGLTVAPTAGLEPATCGLTVHRSTN